MSPVLESLKKYPIDLTKFLFCSKLVLYDSVACPIELNMSDKQQLIYRSNSLITCYAITEDFNKHYYILS